MNILKGKSTRTKIFAVITVFILIFTLAATLALGYFGLNRTLFFDLTYEGFYTLTDTMIRECSFVEELDDKIEIIFCNDPDRLLSQTTSRILYLMSIMLDNTFENVETRTVNVVLNPTAVLNYKATSLSNIQTTDVIISYGDRYRVVSTDAFWYRDSNDGLFAYNGEYKMASLFKSVTAFGKAGAAAAYFLTDHGESVYDAERPEQNRELLNFIYALEDAGMRVKNIKLSDVDSIPADCALLVINNPTEDFLPDPEQSNTFNYVSPLEKIDRYLVSDYGSLMVAKDFERELPLLEEFLFEWGFEFENALVKDEENSLEDKDGTKTQLIGEYNTDEYYYGMEIYSEFASLVSAPKYIVTNTGYIKCSYGISDTALENGSNGTTRIYSPFIYSSSAATAYERDGKGDYSLLYANEGRKDLIGVTTRKQLNADTNENKYSYVICANSKDFLSSAFVGNSAYSNYDVLVALAQNTTRSDKYASTDLGGSSLNSSSFGGKLIISDSISTLGQPLYHKNPNVPIKYNHGITTPEIVFYSILIFLVPVSVAAIGIYVKIKRKYL